MAELGEEMQTGVLKLSVFENSVGDPAPGTRVTLTDTQSGELITEGITDAQGRLPEQVLPAPPESYSLTPPEEDMVMPLPYRGYTVTAQGTDGSAAQVVNVQLYAGTDSLQRIILPAADPLVEIPSPAILGGFPEKIPEAEIKPSPVPEGTVVLPQPVIPGQVVVHNGTPDNDGAANYTIPFKDYIKNVASSEIFDTWPIEAIKANVLAIQSFTLNRVYTEWYRGKGYDFTITSSTAYDQAFVYGRTIFSRISDVVDEMFTMYIARPGLIQPLFAQYCDGVRVLRSGWLSQWGSKELADNGLSALQILRSYYGRNLEIREAERVQGIPLSFQGVLKIGSRGEAVRTIQRQLNAISNRFPLIGKLAVDGIYGSRTAAAVRTFQQIFDLPVNGIVNFGTWYAISDIFTAVEKLAEQG